jgi:hypothetical protein
MSPTDIEQILGHSLSHIGGVGALELDVGQAAAGHPTEQINLSGADIR